MNHKLKKVNLNEDMYEFTCEDCSYTAFTQVDPETNIPDLKNLIVTDPGDIYAVHAYISNVISGEILHLMRTLNYSSLM